MKKKYYFSSILLALLKCAGFLMTWLIVQFAVSLLSSLIIGTTYYGAPLETLNSLLLSLSSEMMIMSNAITIILFMIFYKLIKTPLNEKLLINNSGLGSYSSSICLGFLGQYATLFVINILLIAVIPQQWLEILSETNSSILEGNPTSAFIYTVIMAPIFEELLCRGLILGTLHKAMPKWVAIVLSSLIFGVLHANPLGIIYASAFGILLGWIYTKFNSLIPAIIAHIVFNLTSYFMSESLFNYIMIFISVPLFIVEIVLINKNYKNAENNNER